MHPDKEPLPLATLVVAVFRGSSCPATARALAALAGGISIFLYESILYYTRAARS